MAAGMATSSAASVTRSESIQATVRAIAARDSPSAVNSLRGAGFLSSFSRSSFRFLVFFLVTEVKNGTFGLLRKTALSRNSDTAVCGGAICDVRFFWQLPVLEVTAARSVLFGKRAFALKTATHIHDACRENIVTATLRPSLPLAAWLPLQQAAAGFREECSTLEQLVEQLYTDIDRLAAELEGRADELEEGRRHLAERGRQLAEQRKESTRLSHQLEQQETQLAEALKELRELKTQLAVPPEPGSSGEIQVQLLQKQLAELQVERAVLSERLESGGASREGQISDSTAAALSSQAIASLAEQFADLKQHLQSSSSHLAEAVEQATQRAIANLPPPVIPEGSSPLACAENAPKLADLLRERMELEAELQLVRARSAELQETITRQQRELTGQRAEVSEELRELRKLIEEQALLLVHGEGASSAEHSAGAEESRAVPAAARSKDAQSSQPGDPMVSSVMAQFAKLQKDIAQRRKKK